MIEAVATRAVALEAVLLKALDGGEELGHQALQHLAAQLPCVFIESVVRMFIEASSLVRYWKT